MVWGSCWFFEMSSPVTSGFCSVAIGTGALRVSAAVCVETDSTCCCCTCCCFESFFLCFCSFFRCLSFSFWRSFEAWCCLSDFKPSWLAWEGVASGSLVSHTLDDASRAAMAASRRQCHDPEKFCFCCCFCFTLLDATSYLAGFRSGSF